MINLNLMKEELLRDEGLKLKPYKCTAGKTTIGVGRNLDDRGITLLEADFLLANDISACAKDLDAFLPWWKKMTEVRQRALLNMCFNIGIHRLMGFRKMLIALKKEDYSEAAAQALDSAWARQVGQRAQRISVQILQG